MRYRDFTLLSAGQLLSGIGTQMQVVAVAWQIYLLTHSNIALGLIGLARGLPLIAASFFAGVIADSFDRRRTLFVTQLVLASLSTVLAFLTATGRITPWMIYVLIGLASAAQAVDQPARSALVPSLVPSEALARAVSIIVATREFATIVGPALGGLVIAAAGVEPNYVVDALSYGFVLAAVVLMRTRDIRRRDRLMNLAAVKEGWSFMLGNRIILAVQGLDFLANFFAASTVLFPVFAASIFRTGPEGLGLLYGAGSAGAVVGAVLFALFGRVRRQGIVILVSIAVYGCAITAFGFTPWFLVGLALLAVSGAADSVSASLRQTISQLATPDRLRGRVTAVNTMFVAGGPQLGNVEAGAVASAFGPRWSVALGGMVTVAVVGIMALLSRTVRTYELNDINASSGTSE